MALIWPALLVGLLQTQTAYAQTHTGPATWGVLDFENHSGYGGAEVGRIASDAFVVELANSNRYNLLTRQETQQGLGNLGLTLPLDVIGLQKLGRELGANAVATGEVATISFSSHPRQATASVIVRVVDSLTGELINGALAQGVSNPRAISTNDDDALVNEAINNAAFAAVKQITTFNLPYATVLASRDQDSVLLNKGTRDGLYNGLNMVVTRNGVEVGRIRVSNTSADQSDAVVTERGAGIRPEDRTTAIYQLPAYVVNNNRVIANSSDISSDGASSGGSKRNGFSGITGIIVAILAGALLLSLIKRGNSQGALGGAELGKPVAVEGRQDVLGGQGVAPGISPVTGNPTTEVPVPLNYFPVVVKITASTGNIPNQFFQEYHIYRSNFPAILADPSAVIAFGGTSSGGTSGTTLNNFGQIPEFVQHGAGTLTAYDDGGDILAVSASKPAASIGSVGTGTTTTSGVVTETITAGALSTIPFTGIPAIGDRFQYFIEGLYIQPATNGGGTQNPGTNNSGGTNSTGTTTSTSTTGGNTTTGGHPSTFQLTGRSATNFVTYLEPVILSAGSGVAGTGGSFAGTGPDSVVISVPSVRSGDDYILELSTSPALSGQSAVQTVTVRPSSTGPYSATPADPRNGNPVSFNLQGTNSLRTLFPTATQLFARIGVRDSRNGPTNSLNPYVYCDPIPVPADFVAGTAGTGPPGAPGAVRRH